MTKVLAIAPANDAFGVLVALRDVVDGTKALFVSPPVIGDVIPDFAPLPDEVADNVGLIVESSGSTGRPKRIELSREAVLASANASLERLGGHGQWLLALPANYIAGIQVLVRSIVSDITPVLMNMNVSFTAEAFVRNAQMFQAERRYTSLVPVQLNLLAQAAESDPTVLDVLRRFDAILLGGQAPHMQTVKWLRDQGVKIVITYGMTETAGGCVYDGVPLDGVKIDIDANDQIRIAGSTLANHVGDWFETADLGMVDSLGRLVVMGRADRVIISGGLKLSLDLVEEWARSQAGVSDALALAVNHEKFGQTFLCYVVVDDPETFSIDVEKAVRDLGVAATAAIWANLSEMPLLPNGKPDAQSLLGTFLDYQRSMKQQGQSE